MFIVIVAVGAVAAGVLLGWASRREGGTERHADEWDYSPESDFQGIWEIVHTTKGDLNTGPPVSVRIDGKVTYYEFVIPYMPFGGELTGGDLHRGNIFHEGDLSGSFRKGDRLTVCQDEQMMDYVGKGTYLKPYILSRP